MITTNKTLSSINRLKTSLKVVNDYNQGELHRAIINLSMQWYSAYKLLEACRVTRENYCFGRLPRAQSESRKFGTIGHDCTLRVPPSTHAEIQKSLRNLKYGFACDRAALEATDWNDKVNSKILCEANDLPTHYFREPYANDIRT